MAMATGSWERVRTVFMGFQGGQPKAHPGRRTPPPLLQKNPCFPEHLGLTPRLRCVRIRKIFPLIETMLLRVPPLKARLHRIVGDAARAQRLYDLGLCRRARWGGHIFTLFFEEFA